MKGTQKLLGILHGPPPRDDLRDLSAWPAAEVNKQG